MNLKEKLQDYTHLEFIKFIEQIVDVKHTKPEHNRLIEHFNDVTKHPQGSDLLFYPAKRDMDSQLANEVSYRVKEWYNEQGKLAFKDDVLPQLKSVPDSSTPQSRSQQSLAETQRLVGHVANTVNTVNHALQRIDELLGELSPFIAQSLPHQDSLIAFTTYNNYLSALNTAEYELILAAYDHDSLDMRIDSAKRYADSSLNSTFWDNTIQLQIQQITHQLLQDYRLSAPVVAQRKQQLFHQTAEMSTQLEERFIALAAASRSGPVYNATAYTSSLDDIDWRPRFFTPHRVVSESIRHYIPNVKYAVRSAISGLMLEAHNEDEKAHYASVFFFYYAQPGIGEPYAISIPLSSLMPIEGGNWEQHADASSEVNLPFRMGTGMTKPLSKSSYGARQVTERAHLYVYPTKGNTNLSKVRVRRATKDLVSGNYQFLNPGFPGDSIRWLSQPGLLDYTASAQSEKPTLRPGSLQMVHVPTVETLHSSEDFHSDDCVVVFPEETGIEPIYVLFKSRSEYPGKAYGGGQTISANWLQNDVLATGVPIPSAIANQLSGKVFKRFDLFKETLWKTIAETPEVANYFSPQALTRMKIGRSPEVSLAAQPGTLARLKLRHAVPLARGGNLYDMDNLQLFIDV